MVYNKKNPFQEVSNKETYVKEISNQTPLWSAANLHKSDVLTLEKYLL